MSILILYSSASLCAKYTPRINNNANIKLFWIVNKKRKDIDREIQSIKDSYSNIVEQNSEIVLKYNNKQEEVHHHTFLTNDNSKIWQCTRECNWNSKENNGGCFY